MLKKLQYGGLAGNPANLSYTFPSNIDPNNFIGQTNTWLNGIKKQTSYLNNPVSGIATPEQIKETVNSFGKTSSTAGANKMDFKNFIKNNSANINVGTDLITNTIKALTPQATDTASNIGGQVFNTAGDIVSTFNPLIGAGLKGLGTIITSVGPNVKGNTAKEYTDASSSFGGLKKLDDKKFGLFGIGAGKRYKDKVNERELLRYQSEDILRTSKDNQIAATNSVQNLSNQQKLALSGGWNSQGIRFGKQGTKIDYNQDFSKRVLEKLQKGNKIRTLEELIEYAKYKNPRFIQRLSEEPKGLKFIDDKGNEVEGSHYLEYGTDDKGNAIVYPRIMENDLGELEFYTSEEAYKRAINNKDILIMTPEEAEIFTASPNITKGYKKGWPNFFKKFENGGKMNIIPEGSLHARKHNIESLNGQVTPKGIPVVAKQGEKLEQVAEIEKNEIIFNLDVTNKLEELQKKYKETKDLNLAFEAGDLLVKEILYNTDDRTGLINTIE